VKRLVLNSSDTDIDSRHSTSTVLLQGLLVRTKMHDVTSCSMIFCACIEVVLLCCFECYSLVP